MQEENAIDKVRVSTNLQVCNPMTHPQPESFQSRSSLCTDNLQMSPTKNSKQKRSKSKEGVSLATTPVGNDEKKIHIVTYVSLVLIALAIRDRIDDVARRKSCCN